MSAQIPQIMVQQESDSLWCTLLNDREPSSLQKIKRTQVSDVQQDNNVKHEKQSFQQIQIKMEQEIIFNFHENIFNFPEQSDSVTIKDVNLLGQCSEKIDLSFQSLNQEQEPMKIDEFIGQVKEQQKCNDISRYLFNKQNLKKKWKKNTNVPKYIVRVFLKHFNAYSKSQQSRFKQIFKKTKAQLAQRKTNNYNIPDILKFFGLPECEDQQVLLNSRKVMSHILQNTFQEEILQNTNIKDNKISYMMAVKIYAIRCRSRQLIERVKIF